MSSTVVTLRWRTVRSRLWNPATIFKSCFGCRLESTLRLAWLSTIVTSMSAIAEWFSTTVSFVELRLRLVEQEYWGKLKKSAKGEEKPASDCWVICFWASRDWRSCSSSLTKFIAPPTMDAWSPYTRSRGETWKWDANRDWFLHRNRSSKLYKFYANIVKAKSINDHYRASHKDLQKSIATQFGYTSWPLWCIKRKGWLRCT